MGVTMSSFEAFEGFEGPLKGVPVVVNACVDVIVGKVWRDKEDGQFPI